MNKAWFLLLDLGKKAPNFPLVVLLSAGQGDVPI